MAADPIARVRRICLSLPGATEKIAWGEPTFRAGKIFAMYASAGTHHSTRPSLWCKAKPIDQDLLIRSLPQRVFKPAYVGPSGWVGIWLDQRPDWTLVADIVREAYRLTASKRLIAELEARTGGASAPSHAPSAAARRRGRKRATS